jgi:hypothetical protein
MKANISVIYNIKENIPVGIVCMTPQNGDIAYSTKDEVLMKTLEIMMDNKLFLLKSEKIKGGTFLVEETVNVFDSYYVMSANYTLPLPWWILDVYEDYGDVEELSNRYYNKICNGSDIGG